MLSAVAQRTMCDDRSSVASMKKSKVLRKLRRKARSHGENDESCGAIILPALVSTSEKEKTTKFATEKMIGSTAYRKSV
jgi:hypothetical protein